MEMEAGRGYCVQPCILEWDGGHVPETMCCWGEWDETKWGKRTERDWGKVAGLKPESSHLFASFLSPQCHHIVL